MVSAPAIKRNNHQLKGVWMSSSNTIPSVVSWLDCKIGFLNLIFFGKLLDLRMKGEIALLNYTCDKNKQINTIGKKLFKFRITWFSNFNYCIIIAILTLSCVPLVNSIISFKEADVRVTNARRSDRPCNFLFDLNDVHITTKEILRKYGYPFERHWVTTEDGYILELHRMPPKNNITRIQEGMPLDKIENVTKIQTNGDNFDPSINANINITVPAVLLIHGMLYTSRDFVLNCNRRALAFQLWENGYDVWMGNWRGNPYSRNHTSLNVDSSKFWDFSMDEIAFYDVPAMIDYILNQTSLEKVSIVGHSLGNNVVLATLANRPEYNDKVNIFIAMATAVTFTNTRTPLLKAMSLLRRPIKWLLTTFNHGEAIPAIFLKLTHRFSPNLCRREARKEGLYHGLCSSAYFSIDGYDPGQIPSKFWSVFAAEYPTPTSVKFLVHNLQWIISGGFTMFDEGPLKNLKKYGTVNPKAYPIENWRVPIVIMYGENDWFFSLSDVLKSQEITRKLKPNSDPVEYFKIESPSWNHLSFTHGKDADIYVYSHILRRLKSIYQNYDVTANITE